jgi:hypothetical protein
MTTLAKDTPRDYELGHFDDPPVIAADIIYEGAAVGDNGSGYARPLVAGDPFLGFATQQCDNTQAGNAAGSKRVRTRRSGSVQLAVADVAITDVGKDVFASDDNTFVLTAGSNTRIGTVRSFVSAGVAMVQFEATGNRAAALTDTGGGVVAAGIVDVGAAFDQVKINANFATLAAKINYLIQRGN